MGSVAAENAGRAGVWPRNTLLREGPVAPREAAIDHKVANFAGLAPGNGLGLETFPPGTGAAGVPALPSERAIRRRSQRSNFSLLLASRFVSFTR
jgi:hypothetical protein